MASGNSTLFSVIVFYLSNNSPIARNMMTVGNIICFFVNKVLSNRVYVSPPGPASFDCIYGKA